MTICASASSIALCSHPNNCDECDDVFHANFAFSTLVFGDCDDFNANDHNAIELLFSDNNTICMPFCSVDDSEMGHTRPLTTNKGSDDMFP